jgi:hypothetical protein
MTGSRAQQTCTCLAEKAIEVVRNHEDGTRRRAAARGVRRRFDGVSGSGHEDSSVEGGRV